MSLFDKFKKKHKEEIKSEERNIDTYLEEVRVHQEEELHSSRYEFVTVFTNLIISNKHKEKEGYLFKLLNKRRFDYIGKEFNVVRSLNLEVYDKVIKFLSHLSDTELEENYYLYVAKNALEAANSDLLVPIADIKALISNKSKISTYKHQYSMNVGFKELIPDTVPLLVGHFSQTDSVYFINSDPILDEDHIDLYRTFNANIETLTYLVANIYSIVLWHQLDYLDEPVSLRNIKINNKDGLFNMDLSFALENNLRIKRTYVIDQRITRIIGEQIGIPFDTLVTMDPRVLNEKLKNDDVKRLVKK